jgi:hypothetical protein
MVTDLASSSPLHASSDPGSTKVLGEKQLVAKDGGALFFISLFIFFF